ncbi:MAG: hypothetical protein IPK19_21165 [Chloroflexi bacterium]|nr:hypothetical protein [Chloroflexota bacterium]
MSAIATARQAALLLTVHGYEIPAYAVENDFYRQALELLKGIVGDYSLRKALHLSIDGSAPAYSAHPSRISTDSRA